MLQRKPRQLVGLLGRDLPHQRRASRLIHPGDGGPAIGKSGDDEGDGRTMPRGQSGIDGAHGIAPGGTLAGDQHGHLGVVQRTDG